MAKRKAAKKKMAKKKVVKKKVAKKKAVARKKPAAKKAAAKKKATRRPKAPKREPISMIADKPIVRRENVGHFPEVGDVNRPFSMDIQRPAETIAPAGQGNLGG